MNKTLQSLLLCSLVTVSFIHSAVEQNSQPSGYNKTTKRSRRRLSRAKTAQTAAPVLDKQETERMADLEQKCEPQVLRFDNQPTQADKTLCLFLNRLQFTQEGISTFFSQTFNRREYGAQFLPHNFSHLIQFLEYGKKAEQPHDYFDGVIRLFHTKLKSASFVNAAAFEAMLDKSTPFLADLLPQEKLSLWKDIKKLLWTNFRDNFSFLKQSPMAFFEDISDQLIQKIKLDVTTPDRLRATIMRFMGGSIDKLAWSPDDQIGTWESFKKIANQISLLYERGVINDPFDLNELYWSLIERYCFFLELTGSKLSLATVEKMKHDLNSGALTWLQIEEQEEGLETKSERLIQALIETEAKIRVFKEGVLTEILPY